MTVFGMVINLPHKAGTIVFIVVLIFLMLFEGVLHLLESACHHRGVEDLIKKLYKEFMILGLISFAIFIISEAYEFDKYNEWFLSFEFAHIVLLFVGINFVVESFLLVGLIESRNRTLLRHDNDTAEQLLLEYLELQQEGGVWKTLFNYGLVSVPLPALREKIEYKIIQEYFVRSYNLPAEFKFANYLCQLLRSFVFSLIEVRPVAWLLVAVLAVLNYARIRLIDPLYQSEVCHHYHTHFHHQPSKYYGHHVCQEYTLRYIFVCSMFLSVYLIGVFIASEVYMQRLLGKVLDEEELLEEMEKEDELAAAGNTHGLTSQALAGQPGHRAGLAKKDSLLSEDMGELVEEDFSMEAGKNAAFNASMLGFGGAENGGGGELPPVPPDKTPSPRGGGRKVSYGNVTVAQLPPVSTTTTATSAAAAVPTSPPRSASSPSSGSDGEGMSSRSNASSAPLFGSLGGHSRGMSESLRYDLQSEDGESALARREAAAAAAVAVNAARNRKCITGPSGGAAGVAVGGDGSAPSKQLHRSISEYDVRPSSGSRRHLYSLCLQRIMLVEFEYLAHQSRLANPPPPPPPVSAAPRKASFFRRLGSSLFQVPSRDPEDAVVDAELGRAAANSASQKARSLTKQSFLQSTYNMKQSMYNLKQSTYSMGSAKVISPQEFISASSFTRRRSAQTLRSGESMFNMSAGRAGSQYSTTTSKAPGDGRSTKSALSAQNRTYSAHFFEMERSHSTAAHPHRTRSVQRKSSTHHMTAPGTSTALTHCLEPLRPVCKWVARAALSCWNALLGLEHEDSEDSDEDIAAMQADLSDIFLWSSPFLYFFMVEFALLAQCLYLALWATNFIMIARDSYYPKLWEAALLVPVPLNFWLIQKVIFSACTLKAVVSLDRDVADKICEEALDERNVTERLRKVIRSTLAGLSFEKVRWQGFLFEQFHLFKKEGAAGVTEKDFRLFLHSLQIFLTHTSVARIFAVIDFDRDGRVAWKDLSDIVFPELAQQQLKVNRKATSGKSTKAARSRSSKHKSKKSSQDKALGAVTLAAAPGIVTAYAQRTESCLKEEAQEALGSSDKSAQSGDPLQIQSYRPSAALLQRCNTELTSHDSATFGLPDEQKEQNGEYSPTKGRVGGVAFAAHSDTDSGSEGADRFDVEPVSRFDAEDAEFGETFVNHRSVYLRSKLAAQRREQQEGYGEGVVYGEDSADFWENAENESPLS